jgi:hypothetical protein
LGIFRARVIERANPVTRTSFLLLAGETDLLSFFLFVKSHVGYAGVLRCEQPPTAS